MYSCETIILEREYLANQKDADLSIYFTKKICPLPPKISWLELLQLLFDNLLFLAMTL